MGFFRVGFGAAAGRAQRGGKREARVGVVEERVGGRSDVDRFDCELDCGSVLAAPRERLGPNAAPRDRRPEVVAGERLALVAERLGLGVPIQCEQCASEERGSLRRVDAEPEAPQPVVCGVQKALGGESVALEQLDATGEHVGLEQPVRDAQLFDHVPRGRDHASRRLGAPA